MKEITSHHSPSGKGPNNTIKLTAGAPGAGWAPDEYVAYHTDDPVGHAMFQIAFQTLQRPIGCTNEMLLAIVLDRLEGFQSGPLPSTFNASALYHVRKALNELLACTAMREKVGVEGRMMDDPRIRIDGEQLVIGDVKCNLNPVRYSWNSWSRVISAAGRLAPLMQEEWKVLESIPESDSARRGLAELKSALIHAAAVRMKSM
jgi:hypothetical protein